MRLGVRIRGILAGWPTTRMWAAAPRSTWRPTPPSFPSASAWWMCIPLLLSAQNLFEKMNVWLVQSVAYRHHRLLLYMLHPGEALSKEVMVAARRWWRRMCTRCRLSLLTQTSPSLWSVTHSSNKCLMLCLERL